MEESVPPPAIHETIEEALRNSELRYRRLFETAQDGILILDASTGQITDANPFLLAMLGYTREELLGKQLWEIGLFQDRTLSAMAFEKLRKEGYIRYDDLPLEAKTGRRHEVEFVSNLYKVDDEDVIQCNIRDVTDRKRLEDQLRQAQKMEVVGQMAGGVAHDYNNILTSTLLQLNLLQEDPNLSDRMRHALKQLEGDARRAADLTQQLLLFSRQQVTQLKNLDFNAVLANLLTMLRRLLSKDISLEFEASDTPLWIEADATMIGQVITNLCLNAQDAMAPKGGQVVIEARLVEMAAVASRANLEASSGRFVCLSVADTGSGMDVDTLEHLFEPFFTTKALGKGTGLGLSIVYGIAKQHGGWVEVSSQRGKGSTFRVYFAASTKVLPAQPESPICDVGGGKETILVVEDEAPVRLMIVQGLQLYGYHVFEAASGPEAIQVWDQHAKKIDLLFADMRMPGGMTGLDLFERFKRTKAALKGIVSSGYCEEIVKSQGLTGERVSFLPKPYNMKTLAGAVRTCLDQTLTPDSSV